MPCINSAIATRAAAHLPAALATCDTQDDDRDAEQAQSCIHALAGAKDGWTAQPERSIPEIDPKDSERSHSYEAGLKVEMFAKSSKTVVHHTLSKLAVEFSVASLAGRL
jgi:hypothetical protein